eukprot:CAMPEP_0195029676 /NCGR_PEP_ID=MMETSP0326_2-20130528/57179_1 /TAXON_ID=2866 ORGANISM="Crypthecodinium cohnii, Strain Seligo" /NCGR_SAMPLE_ID=MMETSP0326_2 /ASSEMBLY_ACC=CAM_ASM_000348 /LENGTH=107 /DNA_ID=CAMNT_0040052663 /DNA_START=268 /DNA_END=595 /DNA_ORIENTATION=-
MSLTRTKGQPLSPGGQGESIGVILGILDMNVLGLLGSNPRFGVSFPHRSGHALLRVPVFVNNEVLWQWLRESHDKGAVDHLPSGADERLHLFVTKEGCNSEKNCNLW